jgi:anionic cell wall polymer biosynthesis LytR-Cps2A-Psr (LCP) family protein
MQRQRCVIGSLARQTEPAEVLAAFPKLVKVLKRSVATDIPASRLPTLLEAAGDKPIKVATIGFQPPTYNSGWSSGYPIPDVAKIQSAVRRMTRPAADTTTTTRADPDGLGGVTSTTRAPATRSSSSDQRKPACGTSA